MTENLVESQAQQYPSKNLIAHWATHARDVVDQALAIQAVPAPTFEEADRAALVRTRFEEIGLSDIRVDAVHNVFARTPGSDPDLPALMVTAHLDTVFPRETDLSVVHDPVSRTIYGPGLGDNSLGVAGMVCLADLLTTSAVTPACDIWWVATSGEEGMGDLAGIRQAVTTLQEKLGVVIVLEGIGLGHIYHAGLSVRRIKVTVTGQGGHSWLNASTPSAIHDLVRIAGALVGGIQLSTTPRTTFNIGVIEGGTSINTRAARASMSIDLRSDDNQALQHLEAGVRDIIETSALEGGCKFEVEVVGDRPAGALSPEHPLVRSAVAVWCHHSTGDPTITIGSTDANIPLSRQVPAVCVGITTGGRAHTIEEYIHTGPIAQGMSQLTHLVMLAANHTAEWSVWQGT